MVVFAPLRTILIPLFMMYYVLSMIDVDRFLLLDCSLRYRQEAVGLQGGTSDKYAVDVLH